MRYKKVIFSPTGGTQKVSDILMAQWDPAAAQLDLSDPRASYEKWDFGPDDLVLIAVPSFAGRVPPLAAERLGRLKGNGAKCILLCVYGNRAYEDTLREMEDLAAAAGFEVTAAVAAVAEHSIVHEVAAGRPDAEDEKILRAFAQQIGDRVREGRRMTGQIPGNRPYRKKGGSMTPAAGKKCTACGTCVRVCPAQAISAEHPQKTDASACAGCMRCVAVCPQDARKLNGAVLAAVNLVLRKSASARKENELFL